MRPFEKKFPIRLASVCLAESGLIGEFSNSYLFISTSRKDSKVKKSLLKSVEDEKISAFLYTNGGKNNIVTKFIKKDKGYIVCKE